MRLWQGGYEIHGLGRDAFVRATGGNYLCGAGMMHIVDNIMTIDKSSKDYVRPVRG